MPSRYHIKTTTFLAVILASILLPQLPVFLDMRAFRSKLLKSATAGRSPSSRIRIPIISVRRFDDTRTNLSANPTRHLSISNKMSSTEQSEQTLDSNSTTTANQDQATDENGNPLPLPAPEETSSSTLDMSSGNATVKMDALGPLVVNQDGSLSRIDNWNQMTEIEKKNTLRILGKRNQARREALAAKEGES